MANTTVTVSIGRGAGASQDPLGRDSWYAFRSQVAAALEHDCGGTVHVQDAQSVGVWDGQVEESSTFVAAVPAHTLGVLRARLGVLKARYGQEAIALTVGHTEFV
jgi:hypothetical protein